MPLAAATRATNTAMRTLSLTKKPKRPQRPTKADARQHHRRRHRQNGEGSDEIEDQLRHQHRPTASVSERWTWSWPAPYFSKKKSIFDNRTKKRDGAGGCRPNFDIISRDANPSPGRPAETTNARASSPPCSPRKRQHLKTEKLRRLTFFLERRQGWRAAGTCGPIPNLTPL